MNTHFTRLILFVMLFTAGSAVADFRTYFLEAVKDGHSDALEYLLAQERAQLIAGLQFWPQWNAPQPQNDQQAICDHLRQRGTACRWFLNGGTRIASDPATLLQKGRSALWWASMYGHTHIVRRLLDESKSSPALLNDAAAVWRIAEAMGNVDVMRLLMQRRDEFPQISAPALNDSNCLFMAAAFNQEDEVRRLLSRVRSFAELSNQDDLGLDSLNIAAELGHVEVVRALLESPFASDFLKHLAVRPRLSSPSNMQQIWALLITYWPELVEKNQSFFQLNLLPAGNLEAWVMRRGAYAVKQLLTERADQVGFDPTLLRSMFNHAQEIDYGDFRQFLRELVELRDTFKQEKRKKIAKANAEMALSDFFMTPYAPRPPLEADTATPVLDQIIEIVEEYLEPHIATRIVESLAQRVLNAGEVQTQPNSVTDDAHLRATLGELRALQNDDVPWHLVRPGARRYVTNITAFMAFLFFQKYSRLPQR